MDDRYRTAPGREFGRGYGWTRDDDYHRDYGAARDYGASSARDYAAAGEYGRGERSQGRGFGRDQERYRGAGDDYRGGYPSDGRRTTEYGRGDQSRGSYGSDQGRSGDDRDDRGFFDRAGDEVRSWFGDEEAERRRERDRRYDAQNGGTPHDDHYRSWRQSRINELDRDYDEYRQENAQRFHNEFDSWRTERQGQRQGLNRVAEHMEVLGSDGEHIGTVDKVRGDRIVLTKSDSDAGGHHHSIPSRWIQSVDDKVTIRKTADEAKAAWRDEDRSGALFGSGNGDSGRDDKESSWRTDHNLNRAFPGTY